MHLMLIKYLEDTCNEQELDQVLAFLKTEQGQQHLAALMNKDLSESIHLQEDSRDHTDYDQIFDRIKNRLTKERQSAKTKSITLGSRWLSAAAVVAGFLILAAIWIFILQTGSTTYQTAYGETKSITLSDGSLVTLNAHSSLTVRDDFDEQREVWLEGEAFFEVEKLKHGKDAYIQFIVHTGRLQVEVLGTSFNVQDWDEKTQVVLKSGKVKLTSATHEEVTMEPGELAEVSEKSRAIQKKLVNSDIYSAWTENKLRCNDTPLGEIAKVIEHRYGKKVVFQDTTLKEMAVTGTMPLYDLPLLIEVLKESLTITIQAHEETLVISK